VSALASERQHTATTGSIPDGPRPRRRGAGTWRPFGERQTS
jgi:hypothetical protein